MQREIIQTADGSSSIYVPELNEHYHSIHGAIEESMFVFINTGLKQIEKSSIKIFELGYGTGLNFILSALYSANKNIEYHAIEAYPLALKTIEKLNYPKQLELPAFDEKLFLDFHKTLHKAKLSDKISIVKSMCQLKDYKPDTTFDLIYFDAFNPTVQPELWEKKVFQNMFDMMNTGGILTTYCAKGNVRRALIESGFSVERLPGPPNKRHILRATKNG